MQNIKDDIQFMYGYLTGNQFSDMELDFMSNRELKDLHEDLRLRYDEEIRENMEMFFE